MPSSLSGRYSAVKVRKKLYVTRSRPPLGLAARKQADLGEVLNVYGGGEQGLAQTAVDGGGGSTRFWKLRLTYSPLRGPSA